MIVDRVWIYEGFRRWASFSLRSYQKECIAVTVEKINEGLRKMAVSLPVGCGKTVIFSNLIPKIPEPNSLAKKTLVLAHREELVMQAYNQIRKHNPNSKVSVDQANTRANVEDSDIIVASACTLGRLNSKRLLNYNPSMFKAIIVDEAHHSVAELYSRIFNYFKVFEKDSNMILWGCSATLLRNDNLKLNEVFDEVVYHLKFNTMIEDGWLSPFRIHTIKTGYDILPLVETESIEYEDFNLYDLGRAVNIKSRNEFIASTFFDLYSKFKFKSSLVFAVSIEHVQNLAVEFKRLGILTETITSSTSKSDRFVILEKFKNGYVPVLINCGILTEGTDIPNIDCLVMARPTKSPILYNQMLGRGSRLFPAKDSCHVIDFVDNCSKNTIVTSPWFFNVSNEAKNSLNGDKAVEKDLAQEVTSKVPKLTTTKLNPMKISPFIDECIEWNPFDIEMEIDKFHRIHGEYRAKYRWIDLKSYKCVLPQRDFLIALKESIPQAWLVKYDSKFRIVRKTDLPLTKKYSSAALMELESMLNLYPSKNLKFLLNDFKCRPSPASKKQTDFLLSLRRIAHKNLGYVENSEVSSKQDASQEISKLISLLVISNL